VSKLGEPYESMDPEAKISRQKKFSEKVTARYRLRCYDIIMPPLSK